MNDEEIKIINYADDTTLFARTKEDAKQMLKVITNFKKVSGLAINKEKSEAFWLGRNKTQNIKPLGLKWKQTIKLLGIYISYDKSWMNAQNFDAKLVNVKKKLKMEGKRFNNIWKNITD